MATYRVGIVGCTGIASAPARELSHPIFGAAAPHSHAAGYNCVPATEVVAVCDLLPERTQEFVSKWQHRWLGITQYQDYREMLARENLDIVSVVTSDHRHADITVDAAAAGARAIFCEKPLATTLADADRMIAAIEKHGVHLSVDHSRRWQPQWYEARAAIRNGAIGKVRTVVGKIGGARAMLFRNGTHLTDAVCFFRRRGAGVVVGALRRQLCRLRPALRRRRRARSQHRPGRLRLSISSRTVCAPSTSARRTPQADSR